MRDPKEQELFTGLTMSYPYVKEVVDGNRGALSIVLRLQHRTHWSEMIEWLKFNGYCGEMLWILYKDVFRESLYPMGDFIEYMRNSKHYSERPDVHREFAKLAWPNSWDHTLSF